RKWCQAPIFPKMGKWVSGTNFSALRPAHKIEVDREALRQRNRALRPPPCAERQHAQQRLVVGADSVPLDDLEAVPLGEIEAFANRHRRELLAGDLRLRRKQRAGAVAVAMRVEEEPRIPVP